MLIVVSREILKKDSTFSLGILQDKMLPKNNQLDNRLFDMQTMKKELESLESTFADNIIRKRKR